MQLKTFVALASIFTCASVYASPASLEDRSASPGPGPVVIPLSACATDTCDDCQIYSVPSGECVEIPGGVNQTVSCVKVHTDYVCTVYKLPNCVGSSATLFEGDSTLPWGDTGFDSFRCVDID